MLSPAETKDLYPLMNVDDLYGTLYVPKDGTMDPAGTCTTLSRAASARGATVTSMCTVVLVFWMMNVKDLILFLTVAFHICPCSLVNHIKISCPSEVTAYIILRTSGRFTIPRKLKYKIAPKSLDSEEVLIWFVDMSVHFTFRCQWSYFLPVQVWVFELQVFRIGKE